MKASYDTRRSRRREEHLEEVRRIGEIVESTDLDASRNSDYAGVPFGDEKVSYSPKSRFKSVINRLAPPHFSPRVRMSLRDLKKAASSRRLDYLQVAELLESPEDRDAEVEDQWMRDFLNMEGCSTADLAKLLVDDIYDSPWVFRPDLFESLSSRFKNVRLGDFSRSTEFPPAETNGIKDDDLEPARRIIPDLMLGLAGFIPLARDGLPDELVHESWLDDIRQHLEFDSSLEGYVSVVYGRRCKLSSPNRAYLLARQTQGSLAMLLHAIKDLQHKRMLPQDSLPILVKNNKENLVEVVEVDFSLLEALWEGIADIVQYLEDQCPGANQTSSFAAFAPVDRQLVIGEHITFYNLGFALGKLLIGTLLFIATALISFYGKVFAVDPPTRSHRPINSLPIDSVQKAASPAENPIALAQAVSRIMDCLQLHGHSETISHKEEPSHLPYVEVSSAFIPQAEKTPRNLHSQLRPPISGSLLSQERGLLHRTSLCVQIMCLALQSFAQAHTGKIQFSFIDQEVSMVHLDGGGLQSESAIAYQEKLTCFGAMTQAPVLVFKFVNAIPRPSIANVSNEPCDLVSSISSLRKIWGGHVSDYETFPVRDGVDRALWVGRGIIHPFMPLHNGVAGIVYPSHQWHWTSELDPTFPQISEEMKKISRTDLLRADKILIGAVTINKACPLTGINGQKLFRKVFQDHIKTLDAFAPHWELNTIQVGLQAGQWVIPQFMAGWQKLPGRNKKDSILDPKSSRLKQHLSRYWGVQLCVCTGILRRVPLRHLISTCLVPYMTGRLPRILEWPTLRDEHGMVTALANLHGPKLTEWFDQLSPELETAAGIIICEILNTLQHTGVDWDENLRVAWADPVNGIECLKIPCRKANSWAKMLVDSDDSVAFVCVTDQCLETETGTSSKYKPRIRGRSCRQRSSSIDPTEPLQLSTQVRPEGVDYYGRGTGGDFQLRKGKSYWMGREDLMLTATVDVDSGATLLKIKRSAMPVKLFKRMEKRTTVRETDDEEAVDCLVLADES